MNYVPSINQNNQTVSNETASSHNRHRTLEGRPTVQRIEIHISKTIATGESCFANKTNPTTPSTVPHTAPHALVPGRTYIHIVIHKQIAQHPTQNPKTPSLNHQQIVSNSLTHVHAATQQLAKMQSSLKNSAVPFPLGSLVFSSGEIKNLFLLIKPSFFICLPFCAKAPTTHIPTNSPLCSRQLQSFLQPTEHLTKFQELPKKLCSYSQEQATTCKFTPLQKTTPIHQEFQQKQQIKNDYCLNTITQHQPQQILPQPIFGMTPLFPLKRDEEKKPKKRKESKKKKKKKPKK